MAARRRGAPFGSTAAVLALVVAACASAPSPSTGTAAPASPTAAPVTTPSPTLSPPTASVTPTVRWQELAATGPAAREDHTWTLTGDGRTALLFGGRDVTTIFGDLWSYDLEADAWTELADDDAPPARFGHEAAWVDGVGLVIFAGQAGSAFFDDLWAYDPDAARWAELPSGGDVPVARYGSCAALGPDGRLWISHGFTSDGVRFSDTRAYDFDAGAWSAETPPSGARPVERCLHGCWWTDDGVLTLYAGQTTGTPALGDRWALDDAAWSMVEAALPPPRNLYARTRLDRATLVFGGQAADGTYHGDLWILDDEDADAASVQPEGDGPSGRAGAELVRDATHDRVLLFGGRSDEGALDDLWSLSGPIQTP